MAAPVFESWHLDLIAELRVARLGTIAGDGTPHLVPVCYAFENGSFWVPVDEKPKRSTRLARLSNLERDPRATLLFDRYDEDWTQLAWVRVSCTAVVHARGDSAPDVLVALRRRYSQYASMDLESRPLVAFRPERVVGWRWQGGSIESNR